MGGMADIRIIQRDVLFGWKPSLRCVCSIIISLHRSRSRSDKTIVLFQDIILEIQNNKKDFWWLTTVSKTFSEKLRERLEASAKDSNVAGFKSVVCYRTGLEVSTVSDRSAENSALFDIFNHFQSNVPLRLAKKPLNDLVVRMTLEIAAEYNKPGMIPFFFSRQR